MIQIYYLIVSMGHVWALTSRVLSSGFDQVEIKVSAGLGSPLGSLGAEFTPILIIVVSRFQFPVAMRLRFISMLFVSWEPF